MNFKFLCWFRNYLRPSYLFSSVHMNLDVPWFWLVQFKACLVLWCRDESLDLPLFDNNTGTWNVTCKSVHHCIIALLVGTLSETCNDPVIVITDYLITLKNSYPNRCGTILQNVKVNIKTSNCSFVTESNRSQRLGPFGKTFKTEASCHIKLATIPSRWTYFPQ